MKSFRFSVLSPDEQFFDGEIEALTMRSPDGSLTVYANHQPMIVAVAEGEVAVKQGESWKTFISTGGFAEITEKETVFFTNAAEWEEGAQALTTDAKADAIKALRHKKSVLAHVHSKIEITRAMTRLGKRRSHNF